MTIDQYYDRIIESAAYLQNKVKDFPTVAVQMGTGLSSLADELADATTINYSDIPHFPESTVQSHKGALVIGKLSGVPVAVLAGRWHYYEGYSTKEITFPIRVLRHLGVEHMLFTNVSGGVNSEYNAGDLVVITDHINAIPDHPLRGAHDQRLGPRFPDMMHTYDGGIQQLIKEAAYRLHVNVHSGVYYGLQGPSLETPAEYVMIHRVGADMVGMSTVPEVIVAKHGGMKVGAVSIVSNVCYPPERITETTVEEVIAVANRAASKLNGVLAEVIKSL